jgi:outer membrane protein OmpA-like peptidoglycan-associated protein
LPEELSKSVNTGNVWHHIAIYVRKNIGKAYIDQYRVVATNTLPVGATKVNIKSDRYGIKIKNFRLAAGGDDKYNKIVTDGKFITHGILFDVNQSTIKPESMGALNEIAKLMKAHTDLRFEIDGHTDSDGSADGNMKLSQQRAEAVKERLVKMGIDEARLTAKGFGATKPIDKNDSAEGKANNRRVEFVKL